MADCHDLEGWLRKKSKALGNRCHLLGAKGPHKHKDPTDDVSGIALLLGLFNQDVGSLSLCGPACP